MVETPRLQAKQVGDMAADFAAMSQIGFRTKWHSVVFQTTTPSAGTVVDDLA
jgi:hypothetical protein